MTEATKSWWKHAPLDLKNLNELFLDNPETELKHDSRENEEIPATAEEDIVSEGHENDTEIASQILDDAKTCDSREPHSDDRESSESTSSTTEGAKGQEKKDPDVLIFHGTIVHATASSAMDILPDHVIGVRKGRIIFLEPARCLPDLMETLMDKEVSIMPLHDGSFLMPGFVDAHTHISQYGFVGKLSSTNALMENISTTNTPHKKPMHDDRYVRKMARSAIMRSINNGTTCAAYFCSKLESVTRVFTSIIDQMHQRSVFGLELHLLEQREDVHMLQFIKAADVIHSIRQKNNPLLIPSLTSMLSFPDQLERMIAEASQKEDVLLQINVTESAPVREYLHQWFGLNESQIQHHQRNGMLSRKTVLAHCTNCTDEDFEIVRQTGSSVVHCPNANITMMQSICDVKSLLDKGIAVGLGTDMSLGSSPSMLDAMRHCVQASRMLHLSKVNEARTKTAIMDKLKVLREETNGAISDSIDVRLRDVVGSDKVGQESSVINFKEAFRLATLGGATALNLDDRIGNFETNKDFDAIIVNPFIANGPFDVFREHDTMMDIIEKFIFIGDDRNITHVYVSGTRVK